MNKKVSNQQLMLNQLNKEAADLYHSTAVHFGLSDTSGLILYTLYESKKLYSQKDLCDIWSISKTTLNSAISGLMKQNHAVLLSLDGNNKTKVVALTPSGKKLARQYAKPIMAAEIKAFESLTLNERHQLISLFTKYNDALRLEIQNILGS